MFEALPGFIAGRKMRDEGVHTTMMAQREITRPVILLIVFSLLFFFSAVPARSGDPDFRPAVAASTVLDRFTPEQKKELLDGEAIYEFVVEGEKSDKPSGGGKAFVLIHAPVEECFTRFADIETHTQYFPRKTVSMVLGIQEDGRTSVYKELDFKLKTIRYYVLYTIDPVAHRIEFNLDESKESDLKASQGYFHFIAVTPDTTLFDYGLIHTAVGIKIPGFIRRYLTSKDLPQVVTNYRNWLESGGTWKK
jgi:hypothetical protein